MTPRGRPVVGVAGEVVPVPTSIGPMRWHGAEGTYLEQVERAGGLPVVLPVLSRERAGEVCALVDALVLMGGGDVAPERYGAVRDPRVGGVCEPRDEVEIALVREAVRTGTPLLAVCRGMQVVNVTFGGSLVQHLPDPGHRDPARPSGDSHPVTVAAGSKLHELLGTSRMGVNSLHHQAVDRLGAGLRACAWADDGTIEAIESEHADVIAVQWHPELRDGAADQEAIFGWIIRVADRRQSALTG